ncbi:MAG: type IV pilus assembly protein PilM [Candidatus Omnitrophota bacterium]
MKGKGPGKKEFHVGLDIGTRLIKALELSFENATPKLTKLHFVEITPPATLENTAKALAELLETFKPNTTEVNISLSAPSAIVRFINMPRMKEEDLRNSLRFEAEKYIPFNINEVFIDACILEEDAEEKNQMRVLLAAAKKDVVNSRIEMLKEAGLSVAVIDIDSFACFNAFCNCAGSPDESKSRALLNIGYTQTNVVIARGPEPFFTRDIQIAAIDMAKSISKAFGTEEKESDKFIFEPGEKEAQVLDAARPVLSNLVDELRLSFGYYENQYGKGIDEIYVSGGAAKLPGILNYLEENFGTKPVIWNPFSKFEVSPEVDTKLPDAAGAQFGVSAGLALRK